MSISAQEQSPSASAATSTNHDIELRKAFIRALDTIESKNEVIKSKDEVIAAQESLQAETEKAKEAYKKAFDKSDEAYDTQKKATLAAENGWKDSEARVRQLEKQLHKSDNKLKWMAVGATAAVIATIFIQRRN